MACIFGWQQVLDGFIADFYCREARLIIECDGLVHNRQVEYDQERGRIIATHNLCILRFTNAQIEQNIETVLETIIAAARAHLVDKYQM